jgi:hypothetical protein
MESPEGIEPSSPGLKDRLVNPVHTDPLVLPRRVELQFRGFQARTLTTSVKEALAETTGFEPVGLSSTTLAGERFKPLSQVSNVCYTIHSKRPFVNLPPYTEVRTDIHGWTRKTTHPLSQTQQAPRLCTRPFVLM